MTFTNAIYIETIFEMASSRTRIGGTIRLFRDYTMSTIRRMIKSKVTTLIVTTWSACSISCTT